MDFGDFSRLNSQRSQAPDGFAHTLTTWSLPEWLMAATGELGEAANVMKKVLRLRDETGGIRDDERDHDELIRKFMRELADTAIYLDLTATVTMINFPHVVECGLTGSALADAIIEKFNATSERLAGDYKLTARPRADMCVTEKDFQDAAKRGYEDLNEWAASEAVPPGIVVVVTNGEFRWMGPMAALTKQLLEAPGHVVCTVHPDTYRVFAAKLEASGKGIALDD